MSRPFDPGYVAEPYLTLCTEYPEADVYPPDQFRIEWGPIFRSPWSMILTSSRILRISPISPLPSAAG